MSLDRYREEILWAQNSLEHEEKTQAWCHEMRRRIQRRNRVDPQPGWEAAVANLTESIEIGTRLLQYAREDLDRATQEYADACQRDAEERGRG